MTDAAFRFLPLPPEESKSWRVSFFFLCEGGLSLGGMIGVTTTAYCRLLLLRVLLCVIFDCQKKAIAVGAKFGACDLGVLLSFEKQSELVYVRICVGILA